MPPYEVRRLSHLATLYDLPKSERGTQKRAFFATYLRAPYSGSITGVDSNLQSDGQRPTTRDIPEVRDRSLS